MFIHIYTFQPEFGFVSFQIYIHFTLYITISTNCENNDNDMTFTERIVHVVIELYSVPIKRFTYK